MDKKLIIGISAVATGGLIIGGVMMSGGFPDLRANDDQKNEISAEDAAKIEQLYWEGLQDENKYSFCLGQAKIETVYSEPIFNQNGILTHNSKEVLLFNKESQKFYVMSREIVFKYKGEMNVQFGDIVQKVPVTESGSLSESYSKNEMPIRIDYANHYIATDPETKEKAWVYSDMGGDGEMVMARTGCAGSYQLSVSSSADLLAGADSVAIDRTCSEADISGSYEGDFSFDCFMIDYKQAKDLIEQTKIKEELQVTKETGVFDEQAPDYSSDEPGSAKGDLKPSADPDDYPTTNPQDIQKLLEDLKDDMNGAQTGP